MTKLLPTIIKLLKCKPLNTCLKTGITHTLNVILGKHHNQGQLGKITDLIDFLPILRGFQQYLRKLGRYLTPKHPQEPPLTTLFGMKCNISAS